MFDQFDSELGENLGLLTTEAADPRFSTIDQLSVAELATLMNQTDATVPTAVAAALPQIVAAIEAANQRFSRGGRLIYAGSGTAGRLAVVDASECPPTFSTPPERVVAMISGGPAALVSPVEGAEDDEVAGAQDMIQLNIGPLDTMVGVTASGRTPYVLAAARQAKASGALTIGLSCNAAAALSGVVDYPIEVVVGPELITGSTRLKAGTAQKLVLNMISTIIMIQQGKTLGSYMVDLHASNHKLRERAIRMVEQLSGVDRQVAQAALIDCDWQVKAAIVVARLGVSPQEAVARLAAAGGRLRPVLSPEEGVPR
jgi:N-acetylmuramic acid 6-phosphate etherase